MGGFVFTGKPYLNPNSGHVKSWHDGMDKSCPSPNEPEKPWLIVAAGRQTAAFLRKIELFGFLPKAATPVFQRLIK
jgi:hypothetical protein